MNNKQIEKIKKLLKLSKSANEHEAALALSRAQTLMKELGLHADSPQFSDVHEQSVTSSSRSYKLPSYRNHLIAMVGKAFGCDCHIDAWPGELVDVYFTGHNERPDIAAYTYKVLERQLTSARKNYIASLNKRIKKSTKTARADVFCQAWVNAVQQKVKDFALTPEENQQIAEYVKALHPTLVSSKTRTPSQKHLRGGKDHALTAGYMAGKQASLHHGVNGQEQTKLEYRSK